MTPFDPSEPAQQPVSAEEEPSPSQVDLRVKQSGKAVRVQTDGPHLVGLGGGRLSTGITIHPVHPGTTRVGREDAARPQDVVIRGVGAEREHCLLENTDGTVILFPLCGSVIVDGVRVDSPIRLTQGCMLCFGGSNHFRFNHPGRAGRIKNILPNGDIAVVPAVKLRDMGEIRELSDRAEKIREKTTDRRTYDAEVWDSVDFVDKVSKFEFMSRGRPLDDRSSPDGGTSHYGLEFQAAGASVRGGGFGLATTGNGEGRSERKERNFLSALYERSAAPITANFGRSPTDSHLYGPQRHTEAGEDDVGRAGAEDVDDDGHGRAAVRARSPPQQKRIKTNGSLPRRGPTDSGGIRPPVAPCRFSPFSPRTPGDGSRPDGDWPLPDSGEKNVTSWRRKIERLVQIRAGCWKAVSQYRKKMEDLVVQENETLHELNMEHALIAGEELDEQGNQEKEIEELEDLYRKKRLCQETLNGEEDWEEKRNEDGKEEKSGSWLETEINALKSSIRERKDRLKDLMRQRDVLVKQLKEERESLRKQKDRFTGYLRQEMGKIKVIEEELEYLNLLNPLDLDRGQDASLIPMANKPESEKGVEEEGELVLELLELDETRKRTSDLWTGSDGVCEGSSAITSDSDITDCTENGKGRRESTSSAVVRPDEGPPDRDDCPDGSSDDRKNRNAQRPLTRYLPVRGGEVDLRRHVESAGHQIVLCRHVDVTGSTCRGYLHVLSGRWRSWKKRWVVFDRRQKTLVFYSDRSENKLKDGVTFQCIEEVYVDHEHSSRSPHPRSTFCVKTDDHLYYLVAPDPESMRIWVDVVFTGAEGYRHFVPGFDS